MAEVPEAGPAAERPALQPSDEGTSTAGADAESGVIFILEKASLEAAKVGKVSPVHLVCHRCRTGPWVQWGMFMMGTAGMPRAGQGGGRQRCRWGYSLALNLGLGPFAAAPLLAPVFYRVAVGTT